MNPGIIQRLLREPLLHFIAIGGLLFLAYATVNDTIPEAEDKLIVISPERIERIKKAYRATWKKLPTAAELDKLIENEIREEVYYRDALHLGLDKNDPLVRKRLRQKLEFLSDTGIRFQAPSEEELDKFYQSNKSDYQRDPRLAFEQIFLGENPSTQAISGASKRLTENPAVAPLELGARTSLPARVRLSGPRAVNNIFGPEVFQQIAKLAPGIWGGPINSSYGIHMVRTLDGTPAQTPPIDEIRNIVLKDYQTARLREAREQDYARRRAAYDVGIQYDRIP